MIEAERNITNDKVTEYINGFYEPLTADLGELRCRSEAENVPIILKETESFLRTFLGIAKPKRILEIGCAVAYSAMFFAELTGAMVYTIEKNPEAAETAAENVKNLGYSGKVKIFPGDGEDVINELRENGEVPFDFVFIDAAKSHYKRFLESALPLCNSKTLIISDNVLFRGLVADESYDPKGKYKTNIRKMREFLDFIHRDPRFESSVIAVGDGLALTRLNKRLK